MKAVDREALLVALVIAPATYSRNRFFDLYADPDARRARRRASLIRSIVRHVASLDEERHGEIVEAREAGDGAVTLTYVVPAMGLRRTTTLEPIEMALIRYAIARARAIAVLAPPLPEGDPDRLRIEEALHRLAGVPSKPSGGAAPGEAQVTMGGALGEPSAPEPDRDGMARR
jgi:hypothetical protein